MDRKIITLALCLFGSVFAYSTNEWQCLALIGIALIANAPKNTIMSASFVFYAAASLPTVAVVYAFTESPLHAIVSYALLVTINAAIVGIAARCAKHQWFTVPAALSVLSLPPVGYINAVSLAPLAGWIFPGQGALGLMLLVLLVSVMLIPKKRVLLPNAAVGVFVLIAMNASAINDTNESVQGISLARKQIESAHQPMYRTAYRYQELERIGDSGARIVILPESTMDEWTSLDGTIYSNASQTVYVGTRRYVNDTNYTNVIVDGKTGKVVYEQRTTPPVMSPTEYSPVAGEGAVVNTGISFLICFELASAPRAVSAFINNDNPVVWISNLSWVDGDYLEKRMESVLIAWARLYGNKIEKAVLRHA